MEDKFSDNNFVTRREENNIRYNSKVNFPLNSYVIVENKTNNEIYEVYKSNDGIINKKEKSVHYVLHGLARIFVVSVRITFVYVRAYHPFVSVSIRHSERSEEFFSVLLCAPLCQSV